MTEIEKYKVYVLICCDVNIWEDYDGAINEELGDPKVIGVYKTKEKMIEELTDDNGNFRFNDNFVEELLTTGYKEDLWRHYYLEKKELK